MVGEKSRVPTRAELDMSLETRVRRWVFWAGVVALCLAHVWPRWVEDGAPQPLLGGWLPADMAYHLGWIVAAAGWVAFMCGPIWRDDAAHLDAADRDFAELEEEGAR